MHTVSGQITPTRPNVIEPRATSKFNLARNEGFSYFDPSSGSDTDHPLEQKPNRRYPGRR